MQTHALTLALMRQVRQGYLIFMYKLFTYKGKKVPTLQQASLFVFVFESRPVMNTQNSLSQPFLLLAGEFGVN